MIIAATVIDVSIDDKLWLTNSKRKNTKEILGPQYANHTAKYPIHHRTSQMLPNNNISHLLEFSCRSYVR